MRGVASRNPASFRLKKVGISYSHYKNSEEVAGSMSVMLVIVVDGRYSSRPVGGTFVPVHFLWKRLKQYLSTVSRSLFLAVRE